MDKAAKQMRILLTGGIKSGKSRRALALAADFKPGKIFVATAEALDDEMRNRIKLHKEERAKLNFITIEEPYNIDKAISGTSGIQCIVDCIPMWLNNMYFADREKDWPVILERFIQNMPKDIIIVTNETGMGVIAADELSRRYVVDLGIINSKLASAVDSVELLVSGIPLRVK